MDGLSRTELAPVAGRAARGSGPHALKTVLPNGVRILTERLDHVDSVSLGVWSLTGSSNDPAGSEGLTHVVEHMLFKGTTTRSTLQLAEAIDDIGGHMNGVTDREGMYLYAATTKDRGDDALKLLLDLLLNSTCTQEDLERERDVIFQEIGHLNDSPDEWMHELVPQTIWPSHPLGQPLIGTLNSVAGIGIEALRDYLQREVLRADRLLVAAAGRLDHQRIVDLAGLLMEHIPSGAPQPARPAPAFEKTSRFISEPGTQAHFCLASPGISRTDESRHAFALLETILGGGNSSRLFQEIRENRGLAYELGSYLQPFRDAGVFVTTGGTAPGKLQQVLDLIEQEIALLRRDGLRPDELARAKVQLHVALALAAESTSFRMQHLVYSEVSWGRALSFDEIAAGVDRVTAEEVHDLARSALQEDQRALVAIGPFDKTC